MGALTRRGFLKQAAAGAAALAAPAILPSGVLARPGNPGANDRIVIGGIGIGVMGGSLMRAFAAFDDVRVAAVLHQYEYDDADNMTLMERTGPGGFTRTYGHNNANEVTSMTQGGIV